MEPPRVACKAWDVCLLKALLAEFMGTGIFLFTGLASITQSSGAGSEPSGTAPLHVSLAFGSSAALMSYCALPLSGGHLNPAVTVSMLVAVKVRPAWAMCYILAQLLGGITASALLYGLTPEHARGQMGVNKVSKELKGPGELVLLRKVIVSFQLVLCILATSGSKRDPSKGGPLVIGLSVMLGHLVAVSTLGHVKLAAARPFQEAWSRRPPLGRTCLAVFAGRKTLCDPPRSQLARSSAEALEVFRLPRQRGARVTCWRILCILKSLNHDLRTSIAET
uniref:Aquaporin 14 n=1 Tax=Chelydra serpentina TaxID=8475 RepID=A0A8C3RXY9_CHESE